MLCYPQRLHGEAEVSCVEEQLHSKRNAFAALRKENMEYEQNVEDYKIKLSERYSVSIQHPIFGITMCSSRPLMCVYHYFSVCFLLARKL